MSQQHQESGDCDNDIENASLAATGDWSLVTIKGPGNEVEMVNADLDQPKLQLSELKIKILQGCAKGDDQGCDKVEKGIQAKPLEELKVMMTFLDEKYLNEIVELKVKNLALTQENKAFGEKLKEAEEKMEMEKNELKETIKTIQQGMDELAKENAELRAVPKKCVELPDFSIANPMVNRLNAAKIKTEKAMISENGLQAEAPNGWSQNVYAMKGFSISGEACLPNATIVYYFEATYIMSSKLRYFGVGLSAGYVPDQSSIGRYANSYALYLNNPSCNCYLAGMEHFFGWPMGGSTVKWNYQEDVIGCGLLMNPKKELAIFFTVNGILIGKQIPIIRPVVDCLYPTVAVHGNFEANFGDKPFKYNAHECPGLRLRDDSVF